MRLSVRVSAAAALAAGLVACSDSTGPGGDLDDASLAAIGALPLAAGGRDAPEATLPAPRCDYSESTGRFDCEDVTRDGLTFSRSYAFLDASGRPQRRFDPVTTASINTRTRIVGTDQRPHLSIRPSGSFTIDRTADMTVSGLAGAETSQTMNGVESGSMRSSGSSLVSDGAFSSETVSNDTTVNVVVPIPPRPARGARPTPVFPISGMRISNRTTTFTTEGAEPHTFKSRDVATYSANGIMTLEMTIDGVTRTCTVDLSARTLTVCL